MAKVLEITKEHDSSLYDRRTDEGCITEKVVDITEDCPGANKKSRAVLLFTRDSRGRIVQIAQPYEGEVYIGMHIHFFVNELSNELNRAPRDDTFGSTAKQLGLTKLQLISLIKAHMPTP